jgi:hypothetical protein
VRDVGHGGSQQGTSALMLIAPDARAGVVVLVNSDAAGANALGSQLLKVVLGLPIEHKAIPGDPKLYDGYVGNYQMDGFRMTILRENDRLFALINGQNVQLFPTSIRDYFFKAFDAQSVFRRQWSGHRSDPA